MAITCSSISERTARASSSSAGDGSSVGASLASGDAAGETDACGLGSAATPRPARLMTTTTIPITTMKPMTMAARRWAADIAAHSATT